MFLNCFSPLYVCMYVPRRAVAFLEMLHRDEEGNPKGDGSVCYVKPESVEMAINVLHEGQLRPGVTIEVRRSLCALVRPP